MQVTLNAMGFFFGFFFNYIIAVFIITSHLFIYLSLLCRIMEYFGFKCYLVYAFQSTLCILIGKKNPPMKFIVCYSLVLQ